MITLIRKMFTIRRYDYEVIRNGAVVETKKNAILGDVRNSFGYNLDMNAAHDEVGSELTIKIKKIY